MYNNFLFILLEKKERCESEIDISRKKYTECTVSKQNKKLNKSG